MFTLPCNKHISSRVSSSIHLQWKFRWVDQASDVWLPAGATAHRDHFTHYSYNVSCCEYKLQIITPQPRIFIPLATPRLFRCLNVGQHLIKTPFGIIFIELFSTGKAVHSSQLCLTWLTSQVCKASWDPNRTSARLSLTVFDRTEATRRALRWVGCLVRLPLRRRRRCGAAFPGLRRAAIPVSWSIFYKSDP